MAAAGAAASGGGASEPELLLPDPVPAEPVRLRGQKMGIQFVAGQFSIPITHYIFQGRLDAEALKAAFRRVLSKNPLLAGRAWLAGDGADIEVRFNGALGCPFHTRALEPETEAFLERLDPEAVTRRSFEVERAFERLRAADAGRGEEQLNKEGPLCCATYFFGERLSMVSLGLSHMLFDGWSYFSLLRCWDEELGNPGSSAVLENCGLYNVTHLSPPGSRLLFQMAMGTKSRPLRELYTVRARVREATLAKLKERALETAKPGDPAISRNDAFVAWLANILGTKVFGIMADCRGRAGVPKGAFGNALSSWFGAPERGPGRCEARDVRTALLEGGGAREPGLFTAFSCGADEVAQVNNWEKIQYFPCFGGKLRQSVTTLGLKRMFESSAKNTQRVLLCMPGEYQMTHWGLSSDQATRVAAAWAELGERTVSSVSGAEVEEAMVELGIIPKPPPRPHPSTQPAGSRWSCCRRRKSA